MNILELLGFRVENREMSAIFLNEKSQVVRHIHVTGVVILDPHGQEIAQRIADVTIISSKVIMVPLNVPDSEFEAYLNQSQDDLAQLDHLEMMAITQIIRLF